MGLWNVLAAGALAAALAYNLARRQTQPGCRHIRAAGNAGGCARSAAPRRINTGRPQ
jgi:hypothetical protein